MSTDGRAVTAPTTPSGRYRLRTHELAPVHLPRARASSSSTADGSKVEDLTVIVPARPRVSITGVGATPRGRAVLESVAFDPFSKSESFKLLLQNPEASSKRREAPAAVSEFRQWLLQHFPHLVQTLRSLCVISVESTRLQEELLPDPVTSYNEPVNQCSSKQDRIDEVQEEEDEDNEERGSNKAEVNADSDECWRLMLRYASVRSAVPGEVIASQNVTRSTCVYFLLNGHCTLSFRPMLLRDAKVPPTPSTLPRMHAAMLGCSDRPVAQLRELVAGDCFGLDAAAFGFNHLLTTATAGTARQRNFLGLREVALTYVLCLPYQVVQQLQILQHRRQVGTARLSPVFPYSFAPEAEVFLRNMFLFQAMADSSRRFLAAHLRPVVVARQDSHSELLARSTMGDERRLILSWSSFKRTIPLG
ncbi:hypothetical protein PF004_g9575 [Phytophthora fragariae]|uniref:Cyclic nucleotide-binding domain-containing protein n=1 Tax=Phytophthora fragariae TaxID=53985 RepID=A0A6G0P3D7_9STRA|nr:hypothetical protein PF004_g9575 [Phytophthora fragariae]